MAIASAFIMAPNESYKKFQDLIYKLPIVYDAAEQNVRVIQDFVRTSHYEVLMQVIFLAVKSKRKGSKPQETVKKKNI